MIWSFCFSQQLTNYTTKDGLASNHIYKVTQDANGFIWIATDKGLVKYNGSDFKTFTTKKGLATNDVWGLNATTDGKIWYQSKASKVGYIENDSVFAFESKIKGEILSSQFTNQVGNSISLENGNKSHLLINGKWEAAIDNSKNVKAYFTYINHKTISKFKTNKNHDTTTFINKNNKIVKNFYIKDILSKPHKRGQLTDSLYYWTTRDSYKIINLNTLEITERTLKEEINIKVSQYTRINLINNQLQISGSGFVGILDHQFHIKELYRFPKEIDAHFAIIDKTQNIWLCTFSNGLYKLPNSKKNVSYKFINKKVNYISKVKDKIIATVYNNGYYQYTISNKSFKPLIKEQQFLYQPKYIKALDTEYYISKKRTYTIKNNKLSHFNLKTDVRELIGELESNKELVFYNGSLYGVFSHVVNKINPKTHTIIEEFIQRGVNETIVFNDTFLLATSNGLKQFKDGKIETINFKNQSFDKSILTIHKVSESQLLLTTDGFGAYITDLKTIKQLPKSDYLIVNNAFIENENAIWLATNNGVLNYIKSNSVFNLKKHIDKNNGLPSNKINDILISHNDVFVSTNSGLAILPKNQEKKVQLLDVYFENGNYSNKKITKNNSVFSYESNNSLNLIISSLNFSEDKSNFSYNYKLEPIQNEWINTSTKNINFNDLQPGKYSFKVESNNIKKSLNFEITPLWWQTFSFKTLIVLFTVLLIMYVSWILMKRSQLKKNKKLFEDKRLGELQLKALRSQMNPHFVFNSLAAIQYYINNNEMEASEAYLVKFSKLIRQFFEWSKEKEISIDQEINLITNYLDIEKLRFKDKFEYTINLDKNLNIKTNKLPTMLLQPIVENAINHGIFNKMESGNVTINFNALENKTFKIEIIDDGVGFVNTKKLGKVKLKSSNVLEDRLRYLNQSKQWKISYADKELNPTLNDKGNISTFIIKQL